MMNRLLASISRLTGVGLIATGLLGWVGFIFIAALGGDGARAIRGMSWALGVPLGILITFTLQASRYQNGRKTVHYTEIATQLIEGEERYALILREFGDDGRIVITKGIGKGEAPGFTRVQTIEQVIAAACRSILHSHAVAIVDQGRKYAPPGLQFMRAGNDEWRPIVGDLIEKAYAIFIVASTHPSVDLRPGLSWEVEKICELGVQSRVAVVLPPYDENETEYASARINAFRIVRRLKRGTGASEMMQPETLAAPRLLMLRISEAGEEINWSGNAPAPKERGRRLRRRATDMVTDLDYISGVEKFVNFPEWDDAQERDDQP